MSLNSASRPLIRSVSWVSASTLGASFLSWVTFRGFPLGLLSRLGQCDSGST